MRQGQSYSTLIKKKCSKYSWQALQQVLQRKERFFFHSSFFHIHQFFTVCHSIGECPYGPYLGQARCLCARSCVKVWMTDSMWMCECGKDQKGRNVCVVSVGIVISFSEFFVLIHILFSLKAVCKCTLTKTNNIRVKLIPIQFINKCMETAAQVVVVYETLFLHLPLSISSPPTVNRRNCPVALLMQLNMFNCVCICLNVSASEVFVSVIISICRGAFWI